jgi:hypothetical protein
VPAQRFIVLHQRFDAVGTARRRSLAVGLHPVITGIAIQHREAAVGLEDGEGSSSASASDT